MADLVSVVERYSNPEISRFSDMRSVTIKGALRKGYGFGNVYQDLKAFIRKVLHKGYRITEAGELRRFVEESNTLS